MLIRDIRGQKDLEPRITRIYTDGEERDFWILDAELAWCLGHIFKLTLSGISSVLIRDIRGQKDLEPRITRIYTDGEIVTTIHVLIF